MAAAAPIRIRTGIARFEDGWNVVVEIAGRSNVYEPTFATEAEAEAKAADVAAAMRARFQAHGHTVVPHAEFMEGRT